MKSRADRKSSNFGNDFLLAAALGCTAALDPKAGLARERIFQEKQITDGIINYIGSPLFDKYSILVASNINIFL